MLLDNWCSLDLFFLFLQQQQQQQQHSLYFTNILGFLTLARLLAIAISNNHAKIKATYKQGWQT